MNRKKATPLVVGFLLFISGFNNVSMIQAKDIIVKHALTPIVEVANKIDDQPTEIASAPATKESVTISNIQPTSYNFDATMAESNSNLVQTAYSYLGVPYVFGGSNTSGFDCSGLVQYVARLNHILLPRTSQLQSLQGKYVSLDNLKSGDLVFWGSVGNAYHVGIYIGNDQYIHAPQPGEVVSVGNMQWFKPDFGRRIA
ncbi:C40 family peptidase [Bombilactobacillus thymidiniphilus]|uniref:C40 family peptidase n=1 Tax=Bombilactobacillus thymidiniphilus TaxID=2923363 RepID=A0ABY4PCC3_9LACO|nr:C40 family peptidase [Bombilactobacillus thymidiniphilus]UQS83418.1 C40 family peptidase [Bombilactobacillus thymidiniphilus]